MDYKENNYQNEIVLNTILKYKNKFSARYSKKYIKYVYIREGKDFIKEEDDYKYLNKARENIILYHKLKDLNDVYFISDIKYWGKKSLILTDKGISYSSYDGERGQHIFIDWQLINNLQRNFKTSFDLVLDFDSEHPEFCWVKNSCDLFSGQDQRPYLFVELLAMIQEIINNIINKIDRKSPENILRISNLLKSIDKPYMFYLRIKAFDLLNSMRYSDSLEVINEYLNEIKNGNFELIPESYGRAKLIEAYASESLGNDLIAYQAFIEAYNNINDEYYGNDIQIVKKIELKEKIDLLSNTVSQNVLKVDTERRNILFVTDSVENLPTKSILPVLKKHTNNLHFYPKGSSIDNQLYLIHPFKNDTYILSEKYDEYLLDEKMKEIKTLLVSLGAVEISIGIESDYLDERTENEKIEAGMSYDLSLLKTKLGSVSVDSKLENENVMKTNKGVKWEDIIKLKPKEKHFVPEGLMWLERDTKLESLVTDRLNYGISEAKLEIISSESSYISQSNKMQIEAELQILVKGFNNRLNAYLNIDTLKKSFSSKRLRRIINVKFVPLNPL